MAFFDSGESDLEHYDDQISQFVWLYLDVRHTGDVSHDRAQAMGIYRQYNEKLQMLLKCVKLYYFQMTLNVSFNSRWGKMVIVG